MSENSLGERRGEELLSIYSTLCRAGDQEKLRVTYDLNQFLTNYDYDLLQVAAVEPGNGSMEWRIGRHLLLHPNHAHGRLNKEQSNASELVIERFVGQTVIKPVDRRGHPLVRLTFMPPDSGKPLHRLGTWQG